VLSNATVVECVHSEVMVIITETVAGVAEETEDAAPLS
jgi:hypothetical protein